MPLEDTIQRTGGRKDDEQQIKVVSTNNTAVTLKFVNNAFRKHVMIKSQKTANPTTGENKADNIAKKRRTGANFAEYGTGTKKNTIIDASISDLNTVMLEMAKSCIDLGLADGVTVLKKQFVFQKPYVRQVTMVNTGGTWAPDHTPPLGTTITFDVKKVADGLYEIGHCTGP